ncbi:hypothetical protein DYB37_011355, partial [Aphanomyces astaci]
MANGWVSTMSSSHRTILEGETHIEAHHGDMLASVQGNVLPTICYPRSPGPDGLPNSFYRHFQDALTPILLDLFNSILAGGLMPASFADADVIPLKKAGNSVSAMDYRPIAFLNSAYKLFAQVLALRLQPLLSQIIGDQQQGFVPGRTLDDSISRFQRALLEQRHDPGVPAAASAGIACLDIRKAYDSLERAHLECTMQSMGFPPLFTTLVARLHENTTVRFVVNGRRSHIIAPTSGIRQGCPLAPSLFILGMEPLLASLQGLAWQHGILLEDGPDVVPLCCNAHVDDTDIYLRSLDSLPLVLDVLHRFGDMSGLKVQHHKSFGLCLNTAVRDSEAHGIPFIYGRMRRRYLGLQVGLGDLVDDNWDACLQSTERRLRVASSKTTSLPSRARILQSIVQPKIAFMATYYVPSERWARK